MDDEDASMGSQYGYHLIDEICEGAVSGEVDIYETMVNVNNVRLFQGIDPLVLRFASAVTWSRGPRPWRGFTHGPLITSKFPTRVRVRPDNEHGNRMGRVDMERVPDSV